MTRLPSLLLACCALFAGCSIGDDGGDTPPQIGVKADDDEAAEDLGFPFTATKNTTRVGGGDAIADVAGVAGAVWPATSETTRPDAVVLVDKDNWQGGVAASALAGSIGAPILLSDGDDLPAVSADTLDRLDPKGSDLTKDAEVIRIGSRPPEPGGRKTTTVDGDDVYELASEIDRFHAVATGEPSDDVMIASGERAEYAMPAAAMAARSGDAVILAARNELPEPSVQGLKRHEKPDVFIVGPESVIGSEVERKLRPLARRVQRIEGPTPVQNAIAFARFQSGGFGWGAEVPGQNFTIASTSRPIDAVGAASLATNGVFAPLLLTDDSETLPRSLESYLLDVQPGFENDPRLSVYNHAWILGDEDTISVEQQGRIDEVTALIPVAIDEP
ncbi:MAG: cell wall-binding repeat-containing protein [Thermoleophilaceae bacterium]